MVVHTQGGIGGNSKGGGVAGGGMVVHTQGGL